MIISHVFIIISNYFWESNLFLNHSNSWENARYILLKKSKITTVAMWPTASAKKVSSRRQWSYLSSARKRCTYPYLTKQGKNSLHTPALRNITAKCHTLQRRVISSGHLNTKITLTLTITQLARIDSRLSDLRNSHQTCNCLRYIMIPLLMRILIVIHLNKITKKYRNWRLW